MAEYLTEEEKQEYIEELNRISQKVYHEDYHYLCTSRKINVQRMLKAGGI